MGVTRFKAVAANENDCLYASERLPLTIMGLRRAYETAWQRKLSLERLSLEGKLVGMQEEGNEKQLIVRDQLKKKEQLRDEPSGQPVEQENNLPGSSDRDEGEDTENVHPNASLSCPTRMGP